MTRYSVDFCKEELEKYTAAEAAVLKSQSYSIGGRSLSRANLDEIRSGITYWASQLAEATRVANGGSNGIRMMRCIPHG